MNCSEIAVSTISSVNFLTDVIVPLLSALIGGLMALFGVYITLKRDKNEHEQEQEEKACSFFTILDDGDKRITSDDVCVWGFFSPNMESNSAFDCQYGINMINSQKNEFIIDKLSVNNHDLLPTRKELVTKGLSFLLLVYDLPNIDLSTLKLYITDFSGKHRVYKLMVKDDVASEFIEISKSSH